MSNIIQKQVAEEPDVARARRQASVARAVAGVFLLAGVGYIALTGGVEPAVVPAAAAPAPSPDAGATPTPAQSEDGSMLFVDPNSPAG